MEVFGAYYVFMVLSVTEADGPEGSNFSLEHTDEETIDFLSMQDFEEDLENTNYYEHQNCVIYAKVLTADCVCMFLTFCTFRNSSILVLLYDKIHVAIINWLLHNNFAILYTNYYFQMMIVCFLSYRSRGAAKINFSQQKSKNSEEFYKSRKKNDRNFL